MTKEGVLFMNFSSTAWQASDSIDKLNPDWGSLDAILYLFNYLIELTKHWINEESKERFSSWHEKSTSQQTFVRVKNGSGVHPDEAWISFTRNPEASVPFRTKQNKPKKRKKILKYGFTSCGLVKISKCSGHTRKIFDFNAILSN